MTPGRVNRGQGRGQHTYEDCGHVLHGEQHGQEAARERLSHARLRRHELPVDLRSRGTRAKVSNSAPQFPEPTEHSTAQPKPPASHRSAHNCQVPAVQPLCTLSLAKGPSLGR